jgi:hypothetical protein
MRCVHLQVPHCSHSSSQKMEAAGSPEMTVNFYQIMWCQILVLFCKCYMLLVWPTSKMSSVVTTRLLPYFVMSVGFGVDGIVSVCTCSVADRGLLL